MKVTFTKYIVKRRQKYIVPARYSSYTYCMVTKDNVVSNNIQVSNYGTFKKLVSVLKRRYPEGTEFVIDDKNVWTNYQ